VIVLIPCTCILIAGVMWRLDSIHGRSVVSPWVYPVIALALPAVVLAVIVPIMRRNLRQGGVLGLQWAIDALDVGDMLRARRYADHAARRLFDNDLAQSLRRKANLPDDEFVAVLREVRDGVAHEVPQATAGYARAMKIATVFAIVYAVCKIAQILIQRYRP
jgi:hypothetical protein